MESDWYGLGKKLHSLLPISVDWTHIEQGELKQETNLFAGLYTDP